ncbi:hypothetical protein ACFLTS_02305 [Chloroflexota bacterium]
MSGKLVAVCFKSQTADGRKIIWLKKRISLFDLYQLVELLLRKARPNDVTQLGVSIRDIGAGYKRQDILHG